MTLKTQFIEERLRAGLRTTFAEQLKRAEAVYSSSPSERAHRRQRSGELRQALTSPTYFVTSTPSGVTARTDYPLHIRFLDMKRMGNRQIYNRPIWGIFYRQTLRDMRYEFGDWLRQAIIETLGKAD